MTDFANFAATRTKGLWGSPVLVTFGTKSSDVSVNLKKGIIEGYLTKYFIPGTEIPVIDPYKDIVERGAFTKTITDLTHARDKQNLDYLIPHLWQHNPSEIIGGDKWLIEDSHGVLFETQLAKGVRRADEALELIEQKMLPGISYGYDAIRAPVIQDIRHLKEVALHESSSVTFPANVYAGITSVKSLYFLGGLEKPLAIEVEDASDAPETKDDAPATFDSLVASNARSGALSAFFNLIDMLGQSLLSAMVEGQASGLQNNIDQFSRAVQSWSDDYGDVLATDDSSQPEMGYMSAYHVDNLNHLPELQKKEGRVLSKASMQRLKDMMAHIQAMIDEHEKPADEKDFTIAAIKSSTYQSLPQAPTSDLWSRLAPPVVAHDTPPTDERYSITSLIESVKSQLQRVD